MIRTKIVELSSIDAVAYRQKSPKGKNRGSVIVVKRYDIDQVGMANIDKASGDPKASHNTNLEHYPLEVLQEAAELTAGLPFARRGAVMISQDTQAEAVSAEQEAESPEETATIDSAAYQAVVRAYTDKNGQLSYMLLNRDLIKFAKSSTVVRRMITNGARLEELRDHVLRARLEHLTKNRNLSDEQINLIIDTLDQVSPRHVLREFNDDLRKMLRR